jgi:hypothetical protein
MTIRTISDLLQSALSTDGHRQILTAVCEDRGTDGTFRVSTDTFRLVAIKTGPPVAKVKEARVLVYPEEVAMAIGPKPAYPNWRRIIPGKPTRSVVLYTPALRMAVNAAMVAGKNNASRVRLSFYGKNLTVMARSEGHGESAFTMVCEEVNNMDGLEIAFNGKYLLDAMPIIKNTKQAFIKIEATENSRPIIITFPRTEGAWQEARVIIMPMAIA